MSRCSRCGDWLPHYCPPAPTGPDYPGLDPGGPDVALSLDDWTLDAMGVDR